MKTLISFFALVALAFAYPGGGHGGGGGGGGGGHGGGDLATPITHGHPVVTKVFDSPGLGFFNNYAPKVTGPLDTRGIGGHIYGKGHGHH